MNERNNSEIEALRRRHRAALELSAAAATRFPEAVRQLRRLAAAVTCQSLDIGAYHHTAAEMVRLLEILCGVGAGTVFVYFRRSLDPGCEGHVRTFRPMCHDLLAVLAELDRWRADHPPVRRVK
ncbi:MAG: hypothetical protein RBR20_02720 [Desulfobacterales bacterium]|jgi:hypothetical protein|nr:hypothetical protein [Desulfobacteraceae bacterium]MDY0311015.1 hypothetical protein [Desulfobacterales bacterium]